MKSWHLIIDVARCHDCNDCFLADKDEFVDNDFPPYSAAQPWHGHRWMNIKRKERGQYPLVETAYLPTPCMHCDAAPCLTADGAVYKRDDGLVIIDPVKAKGRKEIVASCPYSVIYWNEEKELAQKCTGCAHLLDDGWTETRCSQVCPTEAIRFVMAEEDDFERQADDEGLERYRGSLGTKPRVWYKNLHRWEKAFVGVSVVFGDSDECAEGATVSVSRDGAATLEGTTDIFGEVKVDHLEPGHEYTVKIAADGYQPAELTVQVDESVNAGPPCVRLRTAASVSLRSNAHTTGCNGRRRFGRCVVAPFGIASLCEPIHNGASTVRRTPRRQVLAMREAGRTSEGERSAPSKGE